MTGGLSLLFAWLEEHLLPTTLATEDARRRAQVLVAASALLMLAGAGFSWQVYAAYGWNAVSVGLLVGVAAAPLNIILLRWGAGVVLPSALLCIEAVIVVAGVAIASQGMLSEAWWWVLPAPILATFLIGPRFGAALAVGVVAIQSGVYVAQMARPEAFFQPEARSLWFTFLASSTTTVGVAAMAVFYETANRRMREAQEQTLRDLEAANAESQGMYASLSASRDRLQTELHAKQEFMQRMRGSSEWQTQSLHATWEAMKRMNDAIETIDGTVETLRQATGQAQESVQHLASLSQEAKSVLGQMVESVEQTATAVDQMASSSETATSNTDNLVKVSEDTSSAMQQMEVSLAEVERHAASTAELAEGVIREAEQGQQSVEDTRSGIQEAQSSATAAGEAIRALGQRIDDVGEILRVIEGIAQQTHLLSLNASIIAAQAGEGGEGFAVVADEIKSLAGRTRSATQEISELLDNVQQQSQTAVGAIGRGERAVQNGVELSQQASQALSKIVSAVGESNDRIHSIARATQEQTESVRWVGASMETLRRAVDQVVEATRQQASGAKLMSEASDRLRSLAPQAEHASRSQANRGKEVGEAIDQVASVTEQLHEVHIDQTESSQEVLTALEAIHTAQQQQLGSVREMAEQADDALSQPSSSK